MVNSSIDKKAQNLKKLVSKPKLLLRRVEVMEKQIKTLQVRIDLDIYRKTIK